MITDTLIGLADAPDIAEFVGTEIAVKVTVPRFDGFQEQETVKVEPDPVAKIDLHPGIKIFAALNVILEATVTLAFIWIALLKVAVVTDPASASELKDEVSTTSVTVIVID